MNNHRYLLFLFWIFSAITILSEGMDWQTGIYLTKPLILTSLSLWFYLNTRFHKSAFSLFMLWGFIFSIGGDTFLMFSNVGAEQFFLFGLGSFLLAQISYTIAFNRYPGFKHGFLKAKPWFALPLLLFFVAIVWHLRPGLETGLKITVTVYALAITIMALSCLHLSGRAPVKAFRWMMIGAVLFLLSDTLIALGKFRPTGLPDEMSRVLIMITYVVAQYLLARGALEAHKKLSV